jgi:hypothetical protein
LIALWKSSTRGQFGAALDMLENAIRACPDGLWADRARRPEAWHLVYHTLFWLDLYLSESPDGFAPPAPFGLEELDPAGVIPERPYTKEELLDYLDHGRRKFHARIEALTEETAKRRFMIGRVDLSIAELFLYNMRHVQHGAAQLNLILRGEGIDVPRWVTEAQGGRQNGE